MPVLLSISYNLKKPIYLYNIQALKLKLELIFKSFYLCLSQDVFTTVTSTFIFLSLFISLSELLSSVITLSN